MSEIIYGGATLRTNADGTVSVLAADDVIGVTAELWADAKPEHRIDDETLVLDTAGAWRYRLRCEYTNPFGLRVLIFDRIKEGKR